VTLEVMVNRLNCQRLRVLKVCHGEALEMEKFAESCWGHICELDPGHRHADTRHFSMLMSTVTCTRRIVQEEAKLLCRGHLLETYNMWALVWQRIWDESEVESENHHDPLLANSSQALVQDGSDDQ
jgi:hypothetical protein